MNKFNQELIINQELKLENKRLNEITSPMVNNDMCMNYYNAEYVDPETKKAYGPVLSRTVEETPYEEPLRELEEGEFIREIRELGHKIPYIKVEKRCDPVTREKSLVNIVEYEKREEIYNARVEASSVLNDSFLNQPCQAFCNKGNVWIPKFEDEDPTISIEFLSGEEPVQKTVEYLKVEVINKMMKIIGTIDTYKLVQYVIGVHVLDETDSEVAFIDHVQLMDEELIKLDSPITSSKFSFKFDLDVNAVNDIIPDDHSMESVLKIEVANITLYEVIPYEIKF